MPLAEESPARTGGEETVSPGGFGRLAPWGRGEMPAFPGLLRSLGPGVVWMALAQGLGELVLWPYIVAKYGLGFLFLLIPACLLQVPVNYEIGRYTLLTGESIWQGFIRLNRWVALAMWVVMTVSFMWLGAFVSAGEMGRIAWPQDWSLEHRRLLWSYLFMAVFLVALLLSRVVYSLIERVMMVVAVVTLAGLAVACCQSRVAAALPEFVSGLAWPSWPAGRAWDPGDATELLTAVTFAGLGGFWTLFYSYWLREKGAGMAAHMGRIVSPITGRPQIMPQVGFLPGESDAELGRWRRWRRFLMADSGVGIAGNILTTLMCCLLAYALLFPEGRPPSKTDMIGPQSAFFGSVWGVAGSVLFLVLASAFLCDTWMTTIDAISRVHTDVVCAYVPAARRTSQQTWYWIFVVIAAGISAATLPLAQPWTLIMFTSVVGFVGTVSFTACLLIWNHLVLPRRLPPAYRPSRWSWLGIAVALAAYVSLAAAYAYVKLSH